MKKITTLSVVVLLAIAALPGCKKKDAPAYSMTATIGGTPYTAALAVADNVGGLEVFSETTTGGTAVTYPYINIHITGSSFATGTYAFDSLKTTNYATVFLSDTSTKIAQSGSVKITGVSADAISGNFTFTCTDGTVISNGKFVAELL